MKTGKSMLEKFASCLIFLSLFAIQTTTAHEPRDGVSPSFNITVGHRTEPAFAGQANAFDFFVRNAVDDSAADDAAVDLQVFALRLRQEIHDSPVAKQRQLVGELRKDFRTPNRYNIHYMPKREGIYGFLVQGTINGEAINEKFVCGEGTLHPDDRAFGCVGKLQRF